MSAAVFPPSSPNNLVSPASVAFALSNTIFAVTLNESKGVSVSALSSSLTLEKPEVSKP